ncbi:cupin [Francisella sp. 19X1-34]|uniref:cupin n=1 Tax=Francisella sp. 19X1-34 TaxID=3087177 RepID=UPI002E34345B|nr:cupin [Francisella sp. 19X1-34]MED7789684.1 cupin [Francisella sp. 19X1-34]
MKIYFCAQSLVNDVNKTISTLDLSSQLQTDYKATSPACLISFINLKKDQYIKASANAGSHVFVVIEGTGYSKQGNTKFEWSKGDVFSFATDIDIEHKCHQQAILYYVNDEPLFSYLGAKPTKATFEATHYPFDTIIKHVEAFNNETGATKRNRNGVLLANDACPLTKTITPTLWSLYNVLPKNSVQLPHRHNSVALDLCLFAPKSGCYTLMSEKVDSEGKLINPIRMGWSTNGAFVTPPGWWHSHHNETDEDAVVFPIQDAGLQTYLRTLFISFIGKKD